MLRSSKRRPARPSSFRPAHPVWSRGRLDQQAKRELLPTRRPAEPLMASRTTLQPPVMQASLRAWARLAAAAASRSLPHRSTAYQPAWQRYGGLSCSYSTDRSFGPASVCMPAKSGQVLIRSFRLQAEHIRRRATSGTGAMSSGRPSNDIAPECPHSHWNKSPRAVPLAIRDGGRRLLDAVRVGPAPRVASVPRDAGHCIRSGPSMKPKRRASAISSPSVHS